MNRKNKLGTNIDGGNNTATSRAKPSPFLNKEETQFMLCYLGKLKILKYAADLIGKPASPTQKKAYRHIPYVCFPPMLKYSNKGSSTVKWPNQA